MRMAGAIEKVRQFVSRRRMAYVRTFRGNVFADEVLEDLAKFCRATESTYHDDPRKHAVAEGRREVWLRIACHLNLTEEELWARYAPSTTRRNDD